MGAFLILLFFAFSPTDCERESFYDKYLKQRGYNKDISPMELTGRPITVQLQVPFQILVDMDDSRQKAQMLLYVSMEWTDERLSFNETEYGFPRAMLPVSLVWVPNIVIYNSLSVEYTTVDEYSLVINSTGSALIYLYATYELFCPVDVQYFPFDTQYCSIDFETAVEKGIAVQLSKTKITESDITYALHQILQNPLYKERTKRLAHILKGNSEKMQKRFVEHVEFAGENDNLHEILNIPDVELTIFQYYCVDVLLIWFTTGLLLFLFAYKLITYKVRPTTVKAKKA